MGYIQNYTRLHIPQSGIDRGYRANELSLVSNWLRGQDIPVELYEVNPPTRAIKAWDEWLFDIAQDANHDFSERAIAFLSLRCYVSWCLATTVIRLISKKYSQKIPLEELISELLRDVEETLMITREEKNLYIQTREKISQPYNSPYIPLSFKILQRWEPERGSSLKTWVTRIATSPSILQPWGINQYTPWRILCQTPPRQINKKLSQSEAVYVYIFREIYQPTLETRRVNRYAPYPEPILEEIERMILVCKTRNIPYHDHAEELKSYLIKLSNRLQERLELSPLLGAEEITYEEPELPNDLSNLILDIIGEHFSNILRDAIEFVMERQLEEYRRKHRTYAEKFYPCMYLWCCRGLRQEEIAHQLNFHQSNVSKITKIQLQVKRIEQFCVDNVLRLVKLEAVYDEEIEANDLIAVTKSIQKTLSAITFEEARREIKSRNRNGANQVAVALRSYLKNQIETP